MTRRRRLATAAVARGLASALASGAAAAEKPPELVGAAEASKRVGAADVRFLFWPLFRASLWSADGAFDWNAPFALSLTYERDFSEDTLARKTVEEMARISGRPEAGFQSFGEEFRACIDDVGPGDRITAVSIAADKARFFQNGEERCTLARDGLRRDFFGIWLDPASEFPEATAKLVGAGP
ncbi:MAG: hypothetical protein RIM80_18855 [Alphaproteobacteria bacterium]